ncbi:uncharacterized protein [Macrobrachium rosenbergii]|uniref:uncharacterized protein n=1 Tax=Macrobrachium rosenbergii TaxID=79674 RepID=UPI0034D45673
MLGPGARPDRKCVLWTCFSILVGVAIPRSAAEEEDWSTLVAVTETRGSTAKLPCNINSSNKEDPVLLVLWYKNASVTPVYSYDSRGRANAKAGSGRQQQWGDEEVWGRSQRVWFDTSTSPANLLVKDVRGQDEGNYRCKVHFKASPSWSQSITLNIRDPPGFPRIQDESGRRLEGPIGPYEDSSTIRMMCLSSGEPPPDLVWSGSGVIPGSGSQVEHDDTTARTLLNVVASRKTAGSTISCSTKNSSVSSGIMNTVDVTLKVNLPPLKVTLETPGEWVSGGQQTLFRCRVIGSSPEPIIQWWLAGRQLTAHAPLTTVSGNVSVSTVKLTPEPGDHGVPLVCKAFSPNLPGTVMHDQITLNVHFVPVATISISGGAVNGVREGGSVVFTCHLKANPKVYNVTWFHNGRTLRRREWGALITNTTLRLPNVTADMRGLYTCVGSNREGDGQSNAVNLNVEFAPICSPEQNREYVVSRGESVTVACSVQAYPSSVTFSWALKRPSDDSLVRLQTVGRDEGLTGHYTLNELKEESVELWCYAKNAIGNQRSPCRFTIYTQGRPGPVSKCNVSNHTASGFVVRCLSGPLRSMNTQYTLLVHAQKSTSGRNPNMVGGGGGASDGSKGGRKTNKKKPQDGNEVEAGGGLPSSTLGHFVRNVTNSSPFFVVGGLQSGQEFTLLVSVSNEEGISPPVVLSAFTLKDNAQTVIGMPSGGGGRSSSGTTSGDGSGSSLSPGSGANAGNNGAMAGGGSGMSGIGGGNSNTDMEGGFQLLVPPMIIVLVTSVAGIVLVAILIIIVLKRRGRSRSRDNEMEQVKLNEEMAFVQTRTPDSTSRETTGSSRKLIEGSEGDRSSGGPSGSGGGTLGSIGSDIVGGAVGGGAVGGGGMTGGGVGGGNVGGMMMLGAGGGVSSSGVMLASVDGGTFGSCNGDLITTTSRDSLLGTRTKQAEQMETFCVEDTTLPILGIQKLGKNTAGHVVLEGLRPMGSPLSASCSSFRSTLPMTGMSMGTLGRGTMAGTLGGTIGGPMGGPMSGTMGGTMGGTIGGTIGGPMGGPMGGTMGGTMGGPMGGVATMTGPGVMMEAPQTNTSHLVHITLTPENIIKERSPTPGPRGNEGVSVL